MNAPLLGGLGLAIVQLPRVRAVSRQQLQVLELQHAELDLHRGARNRLGVLSRRYGVEKEGEKEAMGGRRTISGGAVR